MGRCDGLVQGGPVPENILLVIRVDVVLDYTTSELCTAFVCDVPMMFVKLLDVRFLGGRHGGRLAAGVVEVIGGRRCGIAGSITSGVGLGGAAPSEGSSAWIPCRELVHSSLC